MKNNLIYYIMTYVMYLYPPFIYFMVMINFDQMTDKTQWIVGIITNIVFVLITTGVLYLLALKKRIPKIEKDEKNHFIFGYIGNIVMFLYVYQYLMNLERLVSVFSLVLLLVLAYKYLISNKITFKEVFVFSIIFGIIDYIIIISSGNTLFSEASNFTDTQSIIFQLLFIGALLYTIYVYGFSLFKDHKWSILRYVMLGFLGLFLVTLYADDTKERLLATFIILALFSWIVDVILRLIRKEIKLYDLVFYARLIMLTVILGIIRIIELYKLPTFDLNQMFLLIAIFYVTGLSDICMNIAPKHQKALDINLTIEEYLKQLYKPLTSRYKDVLVFSEQGNIKHDLQKLGRNILLKSKTDDVSSIDDNSISFIIIYSQKIEEIENIIKLMPNIKICVISEKNIDNGIFKTSFYDFNYYVYTI